MAKQKRDALTKEGIIEKMSALRTEITEKVSVRNGTESATELAKLEEDIGKLVKDYNGYSHDLVLMDHLGSPNCIRELCEIRKYDTLHKRTEKEESGFRRMSIEDGKSNIDLTQINDTKIKAPWFYKAELFALWITGETCAQLEIDGFINEAQLFKDLTGFFKISEEAKAAAKESGTPSNRSVLEVLRGVVSAMIGEEQGARVIMPHVRFVQCGLTKIKNGGETGVVQFAKVNEIIALVVDICHMILTNKKVQADISKSLTKQGKEWQKSGFKPTAAPVVEVKIEDAPKESAPAPAVSEKKKGRASAEKKATNPRKSRASAKTEK